MTTEITALNSKGTIAYHSVDNGHLTEVEIEENLKAWAVDKSTHTIIVERR